MIFSKKTEGLKLEEFYLLKAPKWSESGYAIAQCAGYEQGHPVFVDDVMQREIADDLIDGWALLEF